MSSLHNQSVVEDIVSTFKSSQNQSWSTFSDKLSGIPKCKNTDIFKSENPIGLSDEDLPVFGLVPRLEKLVLVSCDKCSMNVKSDCLHYHYKHRHNNQENDLHSVVQFIRPNMTANKFKRPKLNVRKLPEKKIIDGVNIDPVVQKIKTEFDQDEFERISELNRATDQQQNIIQYSDESTSVDLALHCTPGTSYFNEFCTQSSVQYPDHNEVDNQIVDYFEDLTNSLNLIEEMQIKESLDDLDDNINEDIVNCITKVESNEKIKPIIDCTDSINDNEEFYENNHPKKKYDHFTLNQHSSLKTTSSCSDVISNQSSDNTFFDQEIDIEITNSDKILNKLLDDGKEQQSIEYVDAIINRRTINYATESTDSLYKSLDSNEKRVAKIDLTDFINNGDNNCYKNNYYSVNRCNNLQLKPNITSINSNKYPQVMKNLISDNFVMYQDYLINNKRTESDKNLLDDEKNINYETSSEVPFMKPLDSSRKRKSSTDFGDFMNDDNNYFSNHDFKKKYCHSPMEQFKLVTSNSRSSIIGNKLHDNKTNCEKITVCIKDLNKLIKDEGKRQNDECLNDNINEKTVNYVRIPTASLAKLNLHSKSCNIKKKHRKNLKGSMHYTKYSYDNKNKYNNYKFGSSNVSKKQFDNSIPIKNQSSVISESSENAKLNNIFSTVENKEVGYKMNEINISSNILNFSSSKRLNDQKPKLYISFSKDVKATDNECYNDSSTIFDKPLTDEYKETEDKSIANSKDFNFSSPLRLKNDKPIQYISNNNTLKEMDDLYYNDSSTIFDKPLTGEHKEFEDIIEENSKDFNFSSPLRLKNNDKAPEYISTGKEIKAMENQCSIDLSTVFNKPLTDEHKEVEDKMNAKSKDFNFSSPLKLKNDGKPIQYISTSRNAKEMDDQCSSNSSTIFDKPLTGEQNEVDIIEENSKDFNFSSPLKLMNDDKPLEYITTSKEVKAIENQCSIDLSTVFDKPLTDEHKEIEDKIDKSDANFNNFNLSSPPRLDNDDKHIHYIPISKDVKAMDCQCSSDSSTIFDKPLTVELEEVEDNVKLTNANSNILNVSLPTRSLNNEEPKQYIPTSKDVNSMDDQFPSNFVTRFHESSSIEHDKIKDKLVKINVNSKIVYIPLPPSLQNNKKLKKYVPISKNVKAMDDQCTSDSATSFQISSIIEPAGVKDKMDKTNDDSKLLYFTLPPKSLIDKIPKKYIPVSKYVKGIDNDSFYKSSTFEHEKVEDKSTKINADSNILYFSLPPRSLNNEKSKKSIPIGNNIKLMDDQCSSDTVPSFHKFSTVKREGIENEMEHINNNSKTFYFPLPPRLKNNENQEEKDKSDKLNTDSKIVYLPLPPKSLNDKNPKKYFPIRKFVKSIQDQYSSNSVGNFHKSSSVEHEEVEDKMDKMNDDSKILYFPLPPRSLNVKNFKKYIPINKYVKTIDDQCSSDSVTSFHKPSTIEDKDIEHKINTSSKMFNLPLSSRFYGDKNLKKYIPIMKHMKPIRDQCTSFHKSSSVEHEEVEDKINKINDHPKILYISLPPRSLNNKKSKEYIPIKKDIKVMHDQCSSDSDTSFHKSSTASQNAKENIKIESNYMYSNNVSNDDVEKNKKNDKSNIQFDQVPSKLMQNSTQNKWLPSNGHSITFPSHKENPKLAQTNFVHIKSTTNTDADICQDQSSLEYPRVKKQFKLSPISDHVVHEEYCYNGSYDAYYQVANDYTISQALKPLSPGVKYLDSDIDTSSEEEQNGDISESLMNEWCTSSSELSSYKNKIQLESTDAFTDIINNGSSNDAFTTSCDRSSTTLLGKEELKHLQLFDDSSVMTDSHFKIKKEYCQLSSEDDLTQSKLTPNKYDISKESSLTPTSSYIQSVLSRDISTDIKSDNFVTRLQDSVIKNSKYTQTDGFFKCTSHKKCIDPITKIDNSIADSCGTYDDKTKCNQTNLLFGCMDYYNTTKDLIDSHDPINSNAEIVQTVTKNSYTRDISSAQIDEYVANSFTSDSSSPQSTYNTLAPTSVEEYESINDDNCDRYNSDSSHNDNFFNYLTHQPISDNNQELEIKDKTCSSNTDRTVQNEYTLYPNKIDEPTSDIVDKYFQSYKDRLKKTTDEKCINGKNSKVTLPTDIEAKAKKNSKRRLEAVDKENHRYGLWDLRESCLSYIGRTFNFVVRPALRQSHFSEESD